MGAKKIINTRERQLHHLMFDKEMMEESICVLRGTQISMKIILEKIIVDPTTKELITIELLEEELNLLEQEIKRIKTILDEEKPVL